MNATIDLEEIKARIKKSGLKVKHLAGVIGVHPTTLSSYLSGKRELGLPAKKSLFRELGFEIDKAS